MRESTICGNTPNQFSGKWSDQGGNTIEENCEGDCPGDLNGSGEVNGADLGLMIAAWGAAGADLNGDGTTNGADLGLLIAGWGLCN